MSRDYTFYVYILTNPGKTVLYIGFTNSLKRRLEQHQKNRNNEASFAGRYFAYHLIYFEVYQYAAEALAREKQIKRWSRKKKEALIATKNPNWVNLSLQFLSAEHG